MTLKKQIYLKIYELQIIQTNLSNKNQIYSLKKHLANKIMSEQIREKKKTKLSNNQHHQNPYIPQKLHTQILSTTNPIIQNIKKENEIATKLQNSHVENPKQLNHDIPIDKQLTENDKQDVLNGQNNHGIHQTSPNSLSLPQNFKSANVQEKYSILTKIFGNDKKILERKFDIIYKHYRKTMYILYESFQNNNSLLIDLRTFLKYFKDFQLTKKFQINDALKIFKKIASNGLWLDQNHFISIHYKLIDLNDVKLEVQKFDETDSQKINLIGKEFAKSIKQLQENLVKLKDLSDLISEDKLKEVLKTGKSIKIVNKIIQSHTGLTQQDVIQKLKERVEIRKTKKLQTISSENTKRESPNKTKISRVNDYFTQREPIHQSSIYKQIQLPKLRSRQLRNTSVYTLLQMLDTEKERQKLKQLIREKNGQTYLKEFFRKEKVQIIRSPSTGLDMSKMNCYTENLVDSQRSRVRLPKINTIPRNFSLPRMRFT